MFSAFFRKKDFALFILSCLLAQIGAGLTQVAVFGYLSQTSAKTSDFTTTFVLSVLPALFSSGLAGRLIQRVRLDVLLLIAQAVGFLSVFVPLWGVYSQKLYFLQFAEFITAAVFGFIFPISQTYLRRTFQEHELATLSKIDTFIFSINIFVGIGIGTLFYSFFGPKIYLGINIICFALGFLLLLGCTRLNPHAFRKVDLALEESPKIFRKLNLNQKQKQAFQTLLALSSIGSVLMAVSPTFALNLPDLAIPRTALMVSPVLMLVFSRCLGQMIGPFVVPKKYFANFSNSTFIKVSTLVAFWGLYVAAFYTANIFTKCALIICAHIFSNIYYALAVYTMQANFNSEEIGVVSARQFQWNLVIMILAPIAAGWCEPHLGFVTSSLLFLMLSLKAVLPIRFSLLRSKTINTL